MAKNKTAAKQSVEKQTKLYPPVVAVLGHVDHGKTTLLDSIRKTDIAQREHGGITQKIGASSIEVLHEKYHRKITFIDTPGHETFSKMRSRGAQVADIGLLVVSSVDGVMPQTKESITLLLDSKIPFIVVLTMSDLPSKNPEKVKQQLLKEKVMLEGRGGDVPTIEVSAKTGKNIKELLELILLVSDLNPSSVSQKSKKEELKAIVIESKLDLRSGALATVVIKEGALALRDEIICEGQEGKVRSLVNDKGQKVQRATVGEAVEILGFEKVPSVGGIVLKKSEMNEIARGPVSHSAGPAARSSQGAPASLADAANADALLGSPPLASPAGAVTSHLIEAPRALKELKETVLPVIICADTLGSLEAIASALPKSVQIVSQKTGEVSEADVLLAKSTGAIILGFNTKIRNDVLRLAAVEKVLLKNYAIIYELIDEIKDALEGKRIALEEKILGQARVSARFPFEKTFVLGVVVLEGRVAKGDRARLLRGDEVIGEATITSLRQGKNPISKVEKGQEAGVILSPFLDFEVKDVLVCHA
ncbi:MAG: GTP-binding protein [Candidatus Levybacteria bacterium]|nr:GTP-binding protein [Candidatus Levybacteria bacterium]